MCKFGFWSAFGDKEFKSVMESLKHEGKHKGKTSIKIFQNLGQATCVIYVIRFDFR